MATDPRSNPASLELLCLSGEIKEGSLGLVSEPGFQPWLPLPYCVTWAQCFTPLGPEY